MRTSTSPSRRRPGPAVPALLAVALVALSVPAAVAATPAEAPAAPDHAPAATAAPDTAAAVTPSPPAAAGEAGHAVESVAEGALEEAEAAAHGPSLGEKLPLWSTLPFVGILLSIALFPLLAPHFWHHHFPKVSAFWALAFAVPFLIAYGNDAFQSILHIYVIDYIPFIILLWALFTTAGGIFVGGALRGTPGTNTLLLIVGTLMASWIGTTGAAMVMIRPVLRANARRRYRAHTIVFFIFLVANIGGSLTPLGDPPLFLGFLHGVPFFWVTRHLLVEMLTVSVILLCLYWLIEQRLYRREEAAPPAPPAPPAGERAVHVEGARNLVFLLGIMGAVILSGSLDLGLVRVYGHVEVPRENLLRDGLLLMMGALSLLATPRQTRRKNEFSWFPIQEVAILFAGIFMTIIPALAILQVGVHGALGPVVGAVQAPWQYFWVTGGLSSFLDNAPTYLTFFNTALGNLGVGESQVPAMLGFLGEHLARPDFIQDLTAISAGAVFMGANTYIGNAPNFMVKSIAEEAGVPMPSFFGYMAKYSLPILVPSFIVVTLLFFR